MRYNSRVTPQRQIIHVDMDAFYASVEQRDRPELVGKPVIVGGTSKRGVVSAASYEARKFGVRSAMPMVEAMRKCPQAVVLPPRMSDYADVSASVFAIFHRYTPLVEGLSLDEAFLDVTASQSLFGTAEEMARAIKDAIWNELHLRASAGIAPCKFAAKIASDLKKPNALVVVDGDVKDFLAPLPIERMWGIGPKTAEIVKRAGLRTIGDLARSTPERLTRLLGSWGSDVHALANGNDTRDVIPDRDAKSIGSEQTFEEDLRAVDEITVALLAQSTRVASRLVEEHLAARRITIKIKYSDFRTITRQCTLDESVSDTSSIHRAAVALLKNVDLDHERVRLVGVSAGELAAVNSAPVLFPDERIARGRKIEEAARAFRERFGENKVTRASLLDAEERKHVKGVRDN